MILFQNWRISAAATLAEREQRADADADSGWRQPSKVAIFMYLFAEDSPVSGLRSPLSACGDCNCGMKFIAVRDAFL